MIFVHYDEKKPTFPTNIFQNSYKLKSCRQTSKYPNISNFQKISCPRAILVGMLAFSVERPTQHYYHPKVGKLCRIRCNFWALVQQTPPTLLLSSRPKNLLPSKDGGKSMGSSNKNVNRFQQQPESFLNWQSKVKFFLAVLLREVVNSNVAFRTNKCVQI